MHVDGADPRARPRASPVPCLDAELDQRRGVVERDGMSSITRLLGSTVAAIELDDELGRSRPGWITLDATEQAADSITHVVLDQLAHFDTLPAASASVIDFFTAVQRAPLQRSRARSSAPIP